MQRGLVGSEMCIRDSINAEYMGEYNNASNLRPTKSNCDFAYTASITAKSHPQRHSTPVTTKEIPLKLYTEEEVALHCTEKDAWVIYCGAIYDISSWMKLHPGGSSLLLPLAGNDITEQIKKHHKWINPYTFLKDHFIGPVSYTHLTLPTILLVQISVVAVSLKKKKKKQKTETMQISLRQIADECCLH
eukprot:TRINITY_DN59531_c0_g1_i1.p1 TRINITY_DN59531_c0_g1~~TRINITY_DN59531_c0_g1_i1.p1  ORF type:complete len:189 (-),score=37.22 TRINITY_DN59531_c0_g1_i1:23-589(-)